MTALRVRSMAQTFFLHCSTVQETLIRGVDLAYNNSGIVTVISRSETAKHVELNGGISASYLTDCHVAQRKEPVPDSSNRYLHDSSAVDNRNGVKSRCHPYECDGIVWHVCVCGPAKLLEVIRYYAVPIAK
jgi:hypothetical protein